MDMKRNKMLRDTPADDRILRQYLHDKALQPGENPWFTPRLMNKLPPVAPTQPGRWVMTTVTLLAVVVCLVALCYIPSSAVNFSLAELLCVYIATASVVALVAVQIVRLIKTYF